ncbi:MAG: type II secretion system protein GspC [Nevskia sp.]|nr:type II secretion system protein GspC [Nevskia sp.]
MATFSPSRLNALPGAMPALAARYGRRLPELASLLLVLVIAKMAASLVWALVPVPESAQWRPASATAPRVAAKAGVDLGKVANAHLFGQYTVPTEPVLADLASAPDTNLNLTLLGILSNGRNDKDRQSRALIATQGGDEKPYAVGDDIARGVQLQAIFPDRVILLRGGKLETLRLDKDNPGGSLLPSQVGDELVESPADDGENDILTSLGEIRSEILADPSKVANYIRVQPVNTGGGLSGYRIYPGRDRTMFAAAGLRPGDVVTSVNGVALNDPARSLQLLSDLSQSAQINLTVDRGGQPQNFSINLE